MRASTIWPVTRIGTGLIGGGEPLPVRTERHSEDRDVAGQGAAVLAGGRVPQPSRRIVAGGGKQSAIRAERHTEDRTAVAPEGAGQA